MRRIKKIVINICVSLLLILGIYYFGGYHISMTECVENRLRAEYREEEEIVMNLRNEDEFCVLSENQSEEGYSLILLEKVCFLYKGKDVFAVRNVIEEGGLEIVKCKAEDCCYVFIHRTDPRIEKVEIELEYGQTIVVDSWIKDFAGYVQWMEAKDSYRCYDEEGDCIKSVER